MEHVFLPLQAGDRHIPVYSLRDVRDLGMVATALTRGRVAAFYAGMFMLLHVVDEHRRPPGAGVRVRRLRRTHQARPALLLPPRCMLPLIDLDRIHPAFQAPERFVQLYTCIPAPLQLLAPIRLPTPLPRVALAAGMGAPADPLGQDGHGEWPGVAPAATFLWMHDLAWTALADLLELYSTPGTYYAFFPPRFASQPPPVTLADLARQLLMHRAAPFDLVVHDARYEQTGAFSGPTRVCLPAPEEEPALLLLEHGSVGATWLAEASGWPVRVAARATRATRVAGLSDDDLRLLLDRGW